VPDDMTVPQFMLDSTHPRRPRRPPGAPWLIQEGTGREVHYEEVILHVCCAEGN
jgi:4-coumarate--CoA ligase